MTRCLPWISLCAVTRAQIGKETKQPTKELLRDAQQITSDLQNIYYWCEIPGQASAGPLRSYTDSF